MMWAVSDRFIAPDGSSRSHFSSDPASPLLVVQVLPARTQDTTPQALAAAMGSLTPERSEPVALELAATAHEARWLVRARSEEALTHALHQLGVRLPHAGFLPLETKAADPCELLPGEAVSALELSCEASMPLSMQHGAPPARHEEGVDPLLGVLAALSDLGPGERAIARLALAPLSPREARAAARHEAAASSLPRDRDARSLGGPPTPLLLCMAAVILTVGALPDLGHTLMTLVAPALLVALSGHLPALSDSAALPFWGGIVALLVAGLIAAVITGWWRRRFAPGPRTDLRMEARRLPVAHVCLRLFVIGPAHKRRLLPRFHALLTHPGRGAMSALLEELTFRRAQARRRRAALLRLWAAYRQVAGVEGERFGARPRWAGAARRLLGPSSDWSRGVARAPSRLSAETLAALWHLVQGPELAYVPQVTSRAARRRLIAPELARIARPGTHLLGFSEQGGKSLPVRLPPEWLRRHSLIVGKSGAGKSTLLAHLACAAMEEESGVVVIDPHGDLVSALLEVVPESRRDGVVLIDLADPLGSIGLNPLDVTLGRSRDKAIADLLSTLSHIWMHSWGSRMENCFEFGLRTLWEVNRTLVAADPVDGPSRQYTLLDLLPLYTSESFCHRLLKEVADPYVGRWWRQYYDPLPLSMKREIINPVATKVAKFESELARRIIGQSCTTINFAQVLKEQKILLVRLAQGTIGADAAPLLGATLVGLFAVCLQEQERLLPQARVQLPILIDEFQVLEGVDWSVLAQIRKYGASFVLATQSLSYLQKFEAELVPTVLANVTQLYCFQASAQDAWALHRDLGVEAQDLVQLDRHLCYVRASMGDEILPPFSLHVLPLPPGDAAEAETIRRRSRARYSRPPEEVEAHLREALARTRVVAQKPRQALAPEAPEAPAPADANAAHEAEAADLVRHAPRVRGRGGKGQKREQESVPLVFADLEGENETQGEGER
jgi:energy-coupling factor transporter ATP-binding protein EcfA2